MQLWFKESNLLLYSFFIRWTLFELFDEAFIINALSGKTKYNIKMKKKWNGLMNGVSVCQISSINSVQYILGTKFW